MGLTVEDRIEILETRYEERREAHFVIGAVPRLQNEKREGESWREFRSRLGLSAGFSKLKKWCERGKMPDWYVDQVEAELNGAKFVPPVRVPRDISPLQLAREKQRIRREFSDG